MHLTLNAEKQNYRWRPVSDAGPASGLVDADGYQWRTVAEVQHHAVPEAVEVEWRAQLDRALDAGIDVTHLDAHMGAALAPEWCERYVALGSEYDIPVLLTSTLAGYGPGNHLAGTTETGFSMFAEAARAASMPLFDQVLETDFARPAGTPADYVAMLSGLQHLELVFCAFHPNAPGEVTDIEPDTAHVRTDEHALFRSRAWSEWLHAQTFELVSMRQLRDEMRTARS